MENWLHGKSSHDMVVNKQAFIYA